MTDAEIQAQALARLRAAITASGLSASIYARTVLIRDPRTCRRWLAGDSPIPQSVIDFLAKGQPHA
jgi:hypothetical protein